MPTGEPGGCMGQGQGEMGGAPPRHACPDGLCETELLPEGSGWAPCRLAGATCRV